MTSRHLHATHTARPSQARERAKCNITTHLLTYNHCYGATFRDLRSVFLSFPIAIAIDICMSLLLWNDCLLIAFSWYPGLGMPVRAMDPMNFFFYSLVKKMIDMSCGVVELNGNKGEAMSWNGAEIISSALFFY